MRVPRASPASARTAESGSLQVLDWSGYEVKDLWKQYAATHPDMKPKFTFMTNEANALGKMRAGFKPDVVHPCVGYVKDFADSGFVQPWNPALLKNLKHLNPAMVKAGQIGGKQWWIPADWGFDKILYRTDKVKPKEKSWSLMLDDRYKGKIAWFDDVNQLVWAGYYLGFKKPYDQTDAELKKSQDLLKSKKGNVRMFWSSETDLQNAFASGDVWIAYAWPADFVAMKAKKLPVAYMRPKEGALSWVCGLMLGKDSPRVQAAHAYADAWSSTTGRVVARDQLRLRRGEHDGAAGRRRTRQGAAARQPEVGERAVRPHRPLHPTPVGLRQAVGRGQGLLSRGSGLRR